MPELPDLEVFRKNLSKSIINKKIKSAKAIFVSNNPKLEKTFVHNSFISITRRGKVTIFKTAKKEFLLVHLMLTGRFFYSSKSDEVNDYVLKFEFDDDSVFAVIDNYKRVRYEIVSDLTKSKLISNLGPEALEIDEDEFIALLSSSRLGRIKVLLTDQKKIAGIGNAYVDEILWKSKIHPNRSASLLKVAEVKNLYQNINIVLNEGIRKSANDTGDTFEESNRYWMKVYRKAGEACPSCGTKIEKIYVNNRDTFICPKCQLI